jgi:hypothetical protein
MTVSDESRHVQMWHLRSAAVDEFVRAPNQFAAWETLRDRPTADFGLVVTAEADESADPIVVRTSALMFWWGRDDEAEAFVGAAVANGLPDTTTADRQFQPPRTERAR